MFNRLINSFGKPANQPDLLVLHDAELQLAAAALMFAILPVDYKVTSDEGVALRKSLSVLFQISIEKNQRLIARAAAMHSRDPNIVAATTLLKRRTSLEFRQRLLTEINAIMRADGVIHENELDLKHRLERLLGLFPENYAKSA